MPSQNNFAQKKVTSLRPSDMPAPAKPLNGQAFPKINLNEVTGFYENLVSRTLHHVEEGQFPDALKTMIEAAKIAYLVNWRYSDDRLEDALERISEQVLASATPTSPSPAPTSEDRIIFFDSWGMDARGLSLQYIRALKALGTPLLFICESRSETASVHLRAELERTPAATVLYLDGVSDEVEKARKIHEATTGFRPTRIMLHITPWAVGAITAFHAFPTVEKYQINLTDHAFWLGVGCTDYSLEFRAYGRTITESKRSISASQIIMNPYYPIVEDNQKGTLPERREEDIVILTGGAFYKMYGRNGYFFDLIAGIVEDHENVVVWIAGNGRTTLLEERLKRYLESGRVKLIGNRKDINAVIQSCDIYLSTYPVCGALMAQLATVNDKPILSFTSADLVINHLEDIVGTSEDLTITHTDVQAFRDAASKLINEAQVRSAAAGLNKASMHDREAFERRVAYMFGLSEKPQDISCTLLDVDYDVFTSLYLEIENYFQDELAKRIVRNTTGRSALKFPAMTIKAALHIAYFMMLKRLKRS